MAKHSVQLDLNEIPVEESEYRVSEDTVFPRSTQNVFLAAEASGSGSKPKEVVQVQQTGARQTKGKGKAATRKKNKKERDPTKPKKPSTSFFLFRTDFMANYPGKKKLVDVSHAAGEQWRNMTEADKTPFEERAKKLKLEYDKEMEDYSRDKDALEIIRLQKELDKLKNKRDLPVVPVASAD